MNTVTFAKTVGLSYYEKPMKIESDKPSWDWKPLFTMGKMSAGTWQTFQYTGFGAANTTGELQPVIFEPAYELAPIVFTAAKYTKGFLISEELEEDNQQIPGLLGSWAKSIGAAHRYARDVAAASVFNNGTSSSYNGWDSLPLYSNSHATTIGSTTIDNYFGTTSLAWDTLWDMCKYFEYSIFDEAGLPITDTPKYLVTHPSNMDTVAAILESPGKYNTGDHHANTLAGMFTPLYCRLLDSTTAFYMVGENQIDHFHFRIKKEVTTKWKDAFENIGKKCRSHQRFATGHSDYRFTVMNGGA